MGKKILLLLILTLFLSACVATPANFPDTGKLQVSVSISPQAYFIERIAGILVETNIMVGQGDDPHSYEPTPRQMQSISNSQVYFSIGVEFEDAWLPRFASANKELLIVDTAIDIERMPMEDTHNGEHEGVDPHIWLSPKLVKLQVQIIADTLVALDPENKPTYQAGLDSFISDIDQLELAINEQFTPLSYRKFITIHPSLGYFAKDYNLEMIPVEVEGQEPGADQLSKIIDLARANRISVIFTQQAFSSKNAEVLADEIGARVVVLNPLAYEWMSNMQTIANELEASMVKN